MVMTSHFVIAGLITALAVLYQIECDCNRWEATEEAGILSPPDALSRFILKTDSVNKWFQWVSYFKEADGRMVSKGKKYQAIYDVPFLGEYAMLFRLTEYQPNKLFVLESDNFLKPKFTINLATNNEKGTTVTFSLVFRRNSALYHCTLGPLLWFLSGQQLRHSLFVFKMMFPF